MTTSGMDYGVLLDIDEPLIDEPVPVLNPTSHSGNDQLISIPATVPHHFDDIIVTIPSSSLGTSSFAAAANLQEAMQAFPDGFTDPTFIPKEDRWILSVRRRNLYKDGVKKLARASDANLQRILYVDLIGEDGADYGD